MRSYSCFIIGLVCLLAVSCTPETTTPDTAGSPQDQIQELLAVKSAAERLLAELNGSQAVRELVVLAPALTLDGNRMTQVLGRTFAYDTAFSSYGIDSGTGNAPSAAVRYLLYDVDTALGTLIPPLNRVGYFDLSESAPSGALTTRIVVGASTVAEFTTTGYERRHPVNWAYEADSSDLATSGSVVTRSGTAKFEISTQLKQKGDGWGFGNQTRHYKFTLADGTELQVDAQRGYSTFHEDSDGRITARVTTANPESVVEIQSNTTRCGGRVAAITVNGASVPVDTSDSALHAAVSGIQALFSSECTSFLTSLARAAGSLVAPASVAFRAVSMSAADLVVTTSTSGTNVDPDGYIVTVEEIPFSWNYTTYAYREIMLPTAVRRRRIGPAATVTFHGVPLGTHSVGFADLSSGCVTLGTMPRSDTVGQAGSSDAFSIQCGSASPRAGEVAFTAYRNGSWGLFSVRADASGLRLQASDRGLFQGRDLSWSPDGTRLAFACRPASDSEICVADQRDGSIANITHSPNGDREPAWSPDGSHIAFVSFPPGAHAEIHLANPDGTNPRNLTDPDLGSAEAPAWSPDGSRIAFVNGERYVFTMRADGSDWVKVADFASLNGVVTSVSWSPDGSRLAFYTAPWTSPEVSGGLYTANANGSDLRRLASACGCSIPPSWTPDGTRLVYEYAGGIYIINSDGTGSRKFSNGRDPAISPDGARVAYAADGIYVADLDASWLLRLVDASNGDPGSFNQPRWRP